MNRHRTLAALGVIGLSLVVSATVFPEVPEQMAIHWDVTGTPDDHMAKTAGLLLSPVLSLVLVALFAAIPAIDPLGENSERFRAYYEGFVLAPGAITAAITTVYSFYAYRQLESGLDERPGVTQFSGSARVSASSGSVRGLDGW